MFAKSPSADGFTARHHGQAWSLTHEPTGQAIALSASDYVGLCAIWADFADCPEAAAQAFADQAARLFVSRGLLCFDEWTHEWRQPVDVRADHAAAIEAARERLALLANYHRSVI